MYKLFLVYIFLALPIFSTNAPSDTSDARPVLIYVFDPLCGWCFGFSDVIEKVAMQYTDKVDIRLLCGGLATGERVGPLGEFWEYIKKNIPILEKKTGVTFGEEYYVLMDGGNYIYDSGPPSKAVNVVKELKPDVVLQYALRLHKTIFEEGFSLNDTTTYVKLAKEFGVDENQFFLKFGSDEILQKVDEGYKESRALGVTGYPALILVEGNSKKMIANGYMPFEKVKTNLDKALKNGTK